MKVRYHPEFSRDIVRFRTQYRAISESLGTRFEAEIHEAIGLIRARPSSAGHYLASGVASAMRIRRRNLTSFPFFILYGFRKDLLVFASVVPAASDPYRWNERIQGGAK